MSHREPHSYDEHDHYNDDPDHSDSNSAATDELVEEEEEEECPLCMEPFDATDREFHPCKCGYKICLWCWDSLNNIYTSNTSSSSSTSSLLASSSADRPPLAGRCPACRQSYQYPDMTFNAAALHSSLTAKQQKKQHRDKHKRDNKPTAHTSSSSSSSPSAASAASSAADPHRSTSDNNTRVLQRNLMYVANLPAAVAKEELLEDKRYFGKFGKVTKIAITRKSSSGGGGGGGGGSYSAYITFKRAADCAVALQMCHHTLLQGAVVKCSYGTTKYCPFWLRSVPCTMNRCGYLHALASAEDVVGKEELQAMEKKGDGDKPIPFPLQTTVTEALAAAKAYKSVQPADETELSSSSSTTVASSTSSAAASTSSSTATPPASVWKLPAAPSITASSSATPASSATSAPTSSSSTAAAAPSASSSASTSSTAASLRPYVSILAQSQTATQSPPSSTTASAPVSSSVTNDIIRIVPSYLKDKFTPTAASSPQPSPAASGRRKGGSASSTATASPALSPASTASLAASPSMSRSTSKASSASSRASSPIPSPLLQPADTNVAALSLSPPPPAPHSARSVVSPPPPAALSPAMSVASLASLSSSEQQQPPVAAGVPSAAEYQFDFLLYSQFDFSSFFSTYSANDPVFSWLCTPSHAAVHPFARARLSRQQQQRSESRFEFARRGIEDEEGGQAVDSSNEDDSGAVGGGVEGGLSKQADSAWNEQKVDPAAGQGAVMIQKVSSTSGGGRRAR